MIYRFERFELDEERCELRRGTELLPIPRKSFELLRHLVHHAGRVVSKEELFALIWPGEHVSDHVLPVHIRMIRVVLGDADPSPIIRTVRGLGYTMACPVEGAAARRPAAPAPPAASAVLAGRTDLLERLQLGFEGAAAGQGRAVLLNGETGIGKTRLLEEFADVARGQGAIALRARGEPEAASRPFWPWIELFRAGQRALAPDRLPRRAAARGGDRAAAPEPVRALLDAEDGERLDSDAARFRVVRAALALLGEAERSAPLVIAIDDLQWLDEGSLRVWAAVVRQLRERRVLLLAACRDEGPTAPRFAEIVGSLATEAALERIAVRGLDPEGMRELVRGATTASPPAAFLESLCERTGGNPFFARELLQLLAGQGRLAPDAPDWDLSRAGLPRASREALERRLQGVSPECGELLVWAAVIGRRFSFPLLAAASGLGGDRVLALLLEAAQARILDGAAQSGPGGELPIGEYAFSHALLRDAIYSRLTAPERVIRHRAVGEALEQRHATTRGADAGELAHHFFQAAPGGDVDRACEYSVQAARRALRDCDYAAAVRHLEHAARAEELRSPPDLLRACCLALALGDALRRAGRQEESRAALLQAAADARRLGREDLLAYAALGLAKWPRFVGPKLPFQTGRGPNEDQRREVEALVAEALHALDAAAPAGDGPGASAALRARLLAARARAESLRGRLGSAASLGEQALEIARHGADRRALFDALLAKRLSLHVPQDAARALETSIELVETAQRLRAAPLLFAAYEARIPALTALGETRDAEQDVAALTELAERLRAPEYEYTSACFRLGRALSAGRIQLARSLLQRVRALGWSAGDLSVTWKHRMIKLWLLYAEGRSASARTGVEALADRGLGRGVGFHVFHADYFRGIGETRRCAAHFEQAAAQDFEDLEIDDDWLWTLSLAAHVCAYLGDRRRAEQLYGRIAPHAPLNVTSSLYVYRGSAHYPLGALALLLGDAAQAWRHFETAIEFNRRIGARAGLLFAEADYGRGLLRGSPDERARGQSLLEKVTREAGELGVVRLRRSADLRAEI